MFVTYKQLRDIGSEISNKKAFLERKATSKYYNTFLSHSSKDEELLTGVIQILENNGASVYIDNGDKRLPKNPTPETAKILRNSIGECSRFVLFVTNNSKESIWIPWELGLADGLKLASTITLFPSAEKFYETTWAEQEYLGLYQRIIWGKFSNKNYSEWMVLNHHENTAISLRDWIG